MKETIHAMKIIGKKKAPSYDGMADVIFQKKFYKQIQFGNYLPSEDIIDIEIH